MEGLGEKKYFLQNRSARLKKLATELDEELNLKCESETVKKLLREIETISTIALNYIKKNTK